MAAAALIAISLSGRALATERAIGDWFVSSEADRFAEDGAKTRVIALLANRGGDILAVRCLAGKLSLALMGHYTTGDLFLVKFRTDRNAIINTAATAISEKLIEIITTPDMVRQMQSGSEYALRVTGEASNDFIFRAGRGAAKALGEVTKACPVADDK